MIARSSTVLAFGYGIDAAGVTLVNVNYFTARQTLTPDHLLGRVASITSMVMRLPFPIGLIGLGFVATGSRGRRRSASSAGLATITAIAAKRVLAAAVPAAQSAGDSLPG